MSELFCVSGRGQCHESDWSTSAPRRSGVSAGVLGPTTVHLTFGSWFCRAVRRRVDALNCTGRALAIHRQVFTSPSISQRDRGQSYRCEHATALWSPADVLEPTDVHLAAARALAMLQRQFTVPSTSQRCRTIRIAVSAPQRSGVRLTCLDQRPPSTSRATAPFVSLRACHSGRRAWTNRRASRRSASSCCAPAAYSRSPRPASAAAPIVSL